MKSTALVVRSWNGQPIQRRRADGYVNATAMCKANGKLWGHYRENGRCQAYVRALSETIGIPMVSLIETRQGRNGGTWVHPQIAVDLARWISAPFAVWMDAWFLEGIQGQASATAAKPRGRTAAEEAADLIEVIRENISTEMELVAARAGWPVGRALAEAEELLERIGARINTAKKLLTLIDPLTQETAREWKRVP